MGPVPTHRVRVIHEPYQGVPPAQRQQVATDFTASWTDTLEVLCREAGMLGAHEVVLVVDTAVGNVSRRDGGIRADARVNSDYVEVYLPSSDVGPIRWTCGRFQNRGYRGYLPGWQSNVRAIALGMEALRKVDRYGIAGDGQQYRGFQALGPGAPLAMGPAMTVEEAAALLMPDDPGWLLEVGTDDDVRDRYRWLTKTYHPDAGGEPEEFHRLTAARDLVLAHLPTFSQ